MIFNFTKKYKLHFTLWIIYIFYESILIGIFYQKFGKFENYATHFSLNIFLFYFNIWILDRLKFNKNADYLKIFVTSFIEIIIYIPLLAQLNQWFTDYNRPTTESALGIDHRFVLGAVYRSIFFILVSTGFWFLKKFLREKRISEGLEKKRLVALLERENIKNELMLSQNAYIRAQINPHFLFNTLSFVQRRIQKSDSESGEILLLLGKMMRYAISLDNKEVFTPLSNEIEQVENLISLLQIRENYTLSIHFDYDEKALEVKIIPLALLTLCENVFKHGVLHDASNPASISINCVNKKLVIVTKNKIGSSAHTLGSKTGLKNLEHRLSYHYNKDSTFKFEKNGSYFITRAELPIS